MSSGIELKETVTDFSGMPRGFFAHPADAHRLKLVKTIPGIEWITGQLVKHSYEKILRVTLLANAIKVGPDAHPVLQEILESVCDVFDIPSPELYVKSDPATTARTTGSDRPCIVISSGLLDILDKDEMHILLAHEVCHIHCGHMWYLMVCDFVRDFSEFLGALGAPLLGLRLPLEEWRRRAELSCDRGAYLVCGDIERQLGILIKLAGGAEKFGGVKISALGAQEAEFNAETKGISLGRLYRAMMYLDPSNPFSALRAGELNRWVESDDYRAIIAGNYDIPQAAEQPPLWGAFASDSASSGDAATPAEDFIGGIKTAAGGAAGMAQQGVGALQNAFSAFLNTLSKGSCNCSAADENIEDTCEK